VDFLKLHWGAQYAWPTFNVADSAITCGVIIILYATFFGVPTDSLKEKNNRLGPVQE